MSKLRKLARGRDCQVRVPGVCCGDPDTVVLAHLGGAGMGRKRHDAIGAWACHRCHDYVDGRDGNRDDPRMRRLAHLEAVIRTQEALIAEGAIKC